MPPISTLPSERFIALHMMRVRINPDAPTKAPATTSSGLLITKPLAAAATPENELSSATTTGMSAPPIGMTRRTPSTEDSANRNSTAKKRLHALSEYTAQKAAAMVTSPRMPCTTLRAGPDTGCTIFLPASLK